MDDPQKYYAKLKKKKNPNTKGHMSYDSIYVNI